MRLSRARTLELSGVLLVTVIPPLTRRALLRWGATVTGGCALGSTLGAAPAVAAPSGPRLPLPPEVAAPTYLTGSFISAARGGVETNWAIARPPGQIQALRPVIALHGHDANAADVMNLGVVEGLAQVVEAGYPPFAVVSVDGGNGYWHKRVSGEDSGAMVLDELLPMLHTVGLDTSRVAFVGWSMGGYGALLLGSRLGPARTAGICAVSPALWTSGLLTDPGAFDSPVDWARNTVFGLPALAEIPLRVDCGTSDRFYSATRTFVAQLHRPPAGSFSPGSHDVSFWREQLSPELAWLAS